MRRSVTHLESSVVRMASHQRAPHSPALNEQREEVATHIVDYGAVRKLDDNVVIRNAGNSCPNGAQLARFMDVTTARGGSGPRP
jgi:hypothetical protein